MDDLHAAIQLLSRSLADNVLELEATGSDSLLKVTLLDVDTAPAPASSPNVPPQNLDSSTAQNSSAPNLEPGPALVAQSTASSKEVLNTAPEKTKMTLAQLRAHAGPATERLALLENEVIGDCEKCKLHRGRTQLVFGTGNPEADLMFVGVGPGAEEDRQGAPIIGAGGAMLDKMLVAMGLKRDDVYISTLVKCRAPNSREPEPDEVHACEPFLRAQIALVQPKVIVTLGRTAAQILLRTQESLLELHGHWFRYRGVDLLPSFDPNYLLRETQHKRAAWEDLKKVMLHLGLKEPQRR